MPVLQSIKDRFCLEKPFEGLRIGVCLHISTKTANLVTAIKAGGAEPIVCASNPLSTQDDVAASLVVHHEIPVLAIKGEDTDTFRRHLHSVLEAKPDILLDDGADLVTTAHRNHRQHLDRVIGGTEETTTGISRLRSMTREGALTFPVIAVNDSRTKHLFDNRFGTGQSALDGVIRATNLLIAGKTVVGDLFITVTGNRSVVNRDHLAAMKDGAVLANAGHFDVEIDLEALDELAVARRPARPFVEEYTLENNRRLHVLGEGRLVNLVAGEGHPAAVMDLSFANQALAAEFLVKRHEDLTPGIHVLPEEIDRDIAGMKLESMGLSCDTMTSDQKEYLDSWE